MGSEERNDAALLKAFLAGDHDALGELARRHETALIGLARGLMGGRDDQAREAVQEAWVRIIRYGQTFKGKSEFRTWMYRIVINQCHNLRKRNARTASNGTLDEAQGSVIASPAGDTHDVSQQDLHRALLQLDEPRRDVILLCYHADLTYEQVADILDIPMGTLKSRLHAAKTELREQLTQGKPT